MGRISTCAALVAMLLMLGCAATVGDLPAPGERIIANTILRKNLATCLDHHVAYAEQMGRIGHESITAFAIARCANRFIYYSQNVVFGIDEPWGWAATNDELRSCRQIADADLRSEYPSVFAWTDTRRFYALSVCIPTWGTS